MSGRIPFIFYSHRTLCIFLRSFGHIQISYPDGRTVKKLARQKSRNRCTLQTLRLACAFNMPRTGD